MATSMNDLPETHLALRQNVYAAPPEVEQLPTPQPFPGHAVLRVKYATIVSYMRTVYDGSRGSQYPLPLTLGLGAIARVAALPQDATKLKVGDLCLLDYTMRGRDDIGREAESTFLSAVNQMFSPASKSLMAVWKDGTYAEFAAWPLENCHRLDERRLCSSTAEGGLAYRIEDLMFLPKMLVPYGGLGPNGIDIHPGETVIVAPATGAFSSAAVHACLELGAAKVVCMGRNQDTLEKLKASASNPDRVSCIPLTGDSDMDLKNIKDLGHKVDVYFDISPAQAQDSGHFKAATMALRYGGRVCLMGGLRGDVQLPHSKLVHSNITVKGKWMYEPEDIKRLVELVESGVMRLHQERSGGVKPLGAKCSRTYRLDQWRQAFDEAETLGANGYVVFEP